MLRRHAPRPARPALVLRAALAGALLLPGVAACSSDAPGGAAGGATPSGPADARTAVVTHLAVDVAPADYAALADRTQALSRAIGTLCTGPTDAALATARTALVDARAAWSKTRAYSFGPSMSLGLAESVDFWPVATAPLKKRIADGRSSRLQLDSADFGELGLPALESVLFDPAVTKALRGTVVDKAHTCGYLRESSSRVAALTRTAAEQWVEFGPAFAGQGRDSLTALVTSTAQWALLASDAMLSVPAGLAGRKPAPELTRDGPASRGVQDLRDGLATVRALYTGAGAKAGPGLSTLVAERSAPTDAAIMAALAEADTRLAALDSPLRSTVTKDLPAVKAAVKAVKEIQRRMTTDVAQLLGITVTVNDSDGD